MKHRRSEDLRSHDMLQVLMDLQDKGERMKDEEDNNNQDEFEIDAKLSGAKINPALVMNEDAVAQSAVLFFIAGAEK